MGCTNVVETGKCLDLTNEFLLLRRWSQYPQNWNYQNDGTMGASASTIKMRWDTTLAESLFRTFMPQAKQIKIPRNGNAYWSMTDNLYILMLMLMLMQASSSAVLYIHVQYAEIMGKASCISSIFTRKESTKEKAEESNGAGRCLPSRPGSAPGRLLYATQVPSHFSA